MRRLSIDEIKRIEVDILRYVHGVCEKNGLKYGLCGGSLIGAIRHNGYIPWDDDMDIIMPRPDYMRLLDLLKDDKRYRSISMYTNDDYFYSFAKVVDASTKLYERNMDYQIEGMGVYIDIFPLDGLPEDERERKVYYRKIMRLRKLLYISLYNRWPESATRLKRVIKFFYWRYGRLFGWKHWIRRVEGLTRKYDYDSAAVIGCQCAGYGECETFTKEAFSRFIPHKFEDAEFCIPIGYDEYLTKLYGDYMKLPPESERKTRHDIEAYGI